MLQRPPGYGKENLPRSLLGPSGNVLSCTRMTMIGLPFASPPLVTGFVLTSSAPVSDGLDDTHGLLLVVETECNITDAEVQLHLSNHEN